ncbi:FHA domain-containing protein [Nannocystis bainbridge]|uniref:ATPase, T2SS/T4P/T4SS family n=1 Tax=Nannocystis bainbridge TaxID=2995303 RepID=A0ABT5E8F0_9BACT|nr:ATPase, T2SS/T4P/T4SS family [Nannocystis bainbridge]MDC0721097.1 ATPase, T2SS/T4P/T4SS family [Nannocystis bainbridge]
MIRVTIRRQDSSQDEVHEFTLPQITVGRVDRNHVVLPNNRVSSVHARVIENEEGIVLVDNNSTNGTFVNGEMVRGPVVLAPHDAVDIGVFTLHFERAEEGHEVQESYGGGPDFEDPQAYGEGEPQGEYDEFQGGPEPIGEPPDLLLGSAEPTPTDPIAAHDVERIPARTVEQVGPAGSGSFRISPDAPDVPARPYGADVRRTAVSPRRTEPDPEPPRTLDDALALAFRQTSEALLGEPPGPQARVRALAAAREIVERTLTMADPRQRRQWIDWLAQEVAGTGPLDDILADAAVSEVLVAGASHIEVRRGEQRSRHPARFSCEQAVGLALERLVGTRTTASAPIVDGVTEAGVAVHAIGRPIAASGPILVLTRAAGDTLSLAALGERKTLSPAAAEMLSAALRQRLNFLVCASTRADTGALLGAMASELPGDARVVAVHRGPIAAALASRAIVLDAARDATAAVRSAARMRPDFLFVQDLGGVEVAELCATARRPGGATVAVLAADNVEVGLERMQATLALTSAGADPTHLRAYVAGCFDVVVALRRSLSGRDIVAQVAELRRGDLVELFARADDESPLQSTGVTPTLV